MLDAYIIDSLKKRSPEIRHQPTIAPPPPSWWIEQEERRREYETHDYSNKVDYNNKVDFRLK